MMLFCYIVDISIEDVEQQVKVLWVYYWLLFIELVFNGFMLIFEEVFVDY